MPSKIGIKEIFLSIGSFRIKAYKSIDFIVGNFLSFIFPAKPAQNFLPTSIKRLLIIRPGGIGDAIFLFPFLRDIKQHSPGITIDILCEKRNQVAFESQKDVYDNLYLGDSLRSIKNVFKNQYNVVIDTEQWHWLSAILAYFVKADYTIGFDTRPRRKKAFHRAVTYGMRDYEFDNFKNLFMPLLSKDFTAANINNSFRLSDSVLNWAKSKVPSQTIAFSIGASISARRLTDEQSLEIIRQLIDKHRHVVLIGGRDVSVQAQNLTSRISSKELQSFVAQTTFEQTAALIHESQLFIGPDSGLMHLAAAVGTATICIFGPGNLQKWGPRGVRHKIISDQVPCSPCTLFGYTVPTCKGSYHCMRKIDVDKIFLMTSNSQ